MRTPLTVAGLVVALALAAAVPAQAETPPAGLVQLGAVTLDPRLGLTETNGAVQRVFLGAGDDPSLTPSGRTVIVSMRSCSPDYQRQVVRRVTSGLVTFIHEPEQEITRSHRLSESRWISCNLQLARIVAQEHPDGAVRWTAVFMRWDLEPGAHRAQLLDDLLTPAVTEQLRRSVLLWDSYPPGLLGDGDPEEMYGLPMRWSTARGLPYGFAETHQDSPEAWRRAFSWVGQHRPAYFLVYNPEKRPAYRVQDDPAAAQVVRHYSHAAWSTLG